MADVTLSVSATDIDAIVGDAELTAISNLATTDGNFIVANGSTWVAESGATARTSLGLGSIATQAADGVTITGGSVTGITDIAVADGGTGASDAAGARTNLGLGDVAVMDEADDAAARAGTADRPISADVAYSAMAPVALADGATITPDFDAGRVFTVTLGGNRTLANPTNQTAGQHGMVIVTQDGTGSRTLSYGANWTFPGGAPTLSTAASAVDVITYYVQASGTIRATLLKAFS